MLQFRMPAALVARFDEAAREAGSSRSAWLEAAMVEAMSEGFRARVLTDDVAASMAGETRKLRITVDPRVADSVDEVAGREGMTRSSYLVLAALSRLSPSPTRASQ